MPDAAALFTALAAIDGRGYKAYRRIGQAWHFDHFVLHVDHVQGDPFAAPSRVRVVVTPEAAGLPPRGYASDPRALGTAAALARSFSETARRRSRSLGSGRSGEIAMEHPGQKVVAQSAVQVRADGGVEARFTVGLPARGRRVAGTQAIDLLRDDVASVVRDTLLADAHDTAELELHAATNEDAESLRSGLDALGRVAFVADGARLARRSGVDDRPLEAGRVVSFESPESMRVTLETPNSGAVAGMGVSRGVTLVVGGGFHGKSTLLRAVEAGVYNHRPRDGRERVVTRRTAVKVRAEDGRSITKVDISSFIDGLPFGRSTDTFTTRNASGSTSQAAAIAEALEIGAEVLLVDEDTSATNFMIRDRRMQALVPESGEPIIPFVDRVRELAQDGVSTLLVVGGSGDYLDVADRVVRMADYRPSHVTVDAAHVANSFPTGRRSSAARPFRRPPPRTIDAESVDPSRGRRDVYVQVPDRRTLLFGRETIDLAGVEQLSSRAQTRAVGRALALLAGGILRTGRTLADSLDELERLLDEEGLDALDARRPGDLAEVRRFEVAAAMNRLRSLRVG